MLNAVRDSLSDLGSSDDEADGEDRDDEEDIELGKLSEDDKCGWVMDTISKTLQLNMESFRQKQMRLEELTEPGWGDMVDYFQERVMKYGKPELAVPAVVKTQTDMTAPTLSPTTFGEVMQTLDIVPGQSQMLPVMSWLERCEMRLGSENPQALSDIAHSMSDLVPNSSRMEIAKPVELGSFYCCI